MRKKQLLATLVMLSLMQGSVYAAPITEEDLTAGETTILDSNISPIYIIGNTEKEYTVKTDNPDGFKITPEGNGAILVGIEWSQNDNFDSTVSVEGVSAEKIYFSNLKRASF